jgi:urease accessory protein
MNGRKLTRATFVACLALLPSVVEAHLVTTGLGPVFDGMSHLSLSPEEVFPVLALALFAGLRGPNHARLVLFVLPGAWLVGGIAGWLGVARLGVSEQAVTGATFLFMGGLLAADARVPAVLTATIAALLGLGCGAADMVVFLADGPGLGATTPSVLFLIGVSVAVFVLTTLTASLSLPLKATWMRNAVRYTGSCLAALGLLLVGWSIHLAQVTAS